LRLAVEIEREEPQLVADVAGEVDRAAGHDRRGPAAAQVAGFPEELRPAGGPRLKKSLLVADAVAPWSAPLRPPGFLRGDELSGGGVLSEEQEQKEQLHGAHP